MRVRGPLKNKLPVYILYKVLTLLLGSLSRSWLIAPSLPARGYIYLTIALGTNYRLLIPLYCFIMLLATASKLVVRNCSPY